MSGFLTSIKVPRLLAIAGLGGAVVLFSHVSPAQAALVTTNLVGWFDASDNSTLTTSGSSVTAWANKVTGPANLGVTSVTQSTAGSRPVVATGDLTIFNHQVVNFDGVDDFMQSSAFSTPLSQPTQVFAVWRAYSSGGSASIVFDGLSTGRNAGQYEAGHMDMYAGIVLPTPWTMGSNATGTDGSALESTFNFNGTSSTIRSTYDTVTHTNLSTASLKASGDSGTQSMDGVTLGGRFAPFLGDEFSLDGYIGEILIYSTPLTGQNLTDTESYLYNKWFTPEPASISMLAAGAILIGSRRRNASR